MRPQSPRPVRWGLFHVHRAIIARMGRHQSKIDEKTQAEIIQRIADGEPLRSIAKDTGIPESTIRSRFSRISAQAKTVANQLVDAGTRLAELPIAAQVVASDIAARMRYLQDVTTSVAAKGAVVADIMMAEAERRGRGIGPSAEVEELAAVSGCVRTATEAVKPALTLLAMHKDAVKPESPPVPRIVVDFSDE